MIQLLIKIPSETVFPQLCFLLESLGLSNVVDVLQTDYLMVKGDLPVEDHFLSTASLMAGEILKGEDESMIQAVSLAIAEECQVVKEACCRQMEPAKNGVAGEVERVDMINQRIAEIRRELADLRPISGLSKSVSQVTEYSGRKKKMAKNSESSNDIDQNISGLQEDIEKIRDNFSDMIEERRNCFAILKEEDNGRLDEHVRRLVDANKSKGKGNKNVLTDSVDAKIRNGRGGARGRLEDLEIHAQEQEEAIRNLQRHLLETQQELEAAIAEVAYWKKRSEVLEKVRRIGYHSMETTEPGKKGKITISKAEFAKDPDKYDPELQQLRERIESARGRSADLRSRRLKTSDMNDGRSDVLSCSNSCRLHCTPCMGMCTKHCH